MKIPRFLIVNMILMWLLLAIAFLIRDQAWLAGTWMGPVVSLAVTLSMIGLVIHSIWRAIQAKASLNGKPQKRISRSATIAILSIVLLFIVFVSIILPDIIIRRQVLFSEVQERVRNSQLAETVLGQDIHAGWPIQGTYETTGGIGHSSFSVPIGGSHGKGQLHVDAVQQNGAWEIVRLTLSFDRTEAELLAKP